MVWKWLKYLFSSEVPDYQTPVEIPNAQLRQEQPAAGKLDNVDRRVQEPTETPSPSLLDLISAKTEQFSRHRQTGKRKKGVEHPLAYYFRDNEKIYIRQGELWKQDKYQEAHDNILFDDETGCRLHVRLGKLGVGKRHFFYRPKDDDGAQCLPPIDDFTEEIREDKSEHEQRISAILNIRKPRFCQKLITFDSEDLSRKYAERVQNKNQEEAPREFEQFTLANIRGYNWRPNFEFRIEEGIRVCPDIIGEPRKQVASKQSPSIYVEVIDSHYPTEQTFQAYLKRSLREDLIVLFDFVRSEKRDNFYLRTFKGNMRTIFYIAGGSVWKNTNRLRTKSGFEYTPKLLEDRVKQDITISARKNGQRPSSYGHGSS